MKRNSKISTGLSQIAIKTLLIYQKANILFGRSQCRFFPSCSNYAIEALEKKPIYIAIFAIIKRIMRCNQFFKGGFDPVE